MKMKPAAMLAIQLPRCAQLMKKSQDCADPPSGIKRQKLVFNKIYAIINFYSASAKISLLITGAQYNDEKTLRSSAAALLSACSKPPAADFSGEWEAVNQGGGSERKLTIVKTGEGYSIQDEFKLDADAARPSSSSQVTGKAASNGKIQYDKHPDTELSIDEASGLLIWTAKAKARRLYSSALFKQKKSGICLIFYYERNHSTASASLVTRSTSSSVVLPASTLRRPSSRIEPECLRA